MGYKKLQSEIALGNLKAIERMDALFEKNRLRKKRKYILNYGVEMIEELKLQDQSETIRILKKITYERLRFKEASKPPQQIQSFFDNNYIFNEKEEDRITIENLLKKANEAGLSEMLDKDTLTAEIIYFILEIESGNWYA